MTLANRLAPTLLRFLSDENFVRLQFLHHQRRLPRLRNPITFNEKILWLKLYWRDERLPKCVDKWAVREFVEARLSKDALIPMVGVYCDAEEIPWEHLPRQFVLKATHGSGWNVVCRDKKELDRETVKAKLNMWLRQDFYRIGREWAYRFVPPRIVCEEYLPTLDGGHPPDYKIFCFHGEPTYIQVDYGRLERHTRNIYDIRLNRIPCSLEYPSEPGRYELPENIDDLLEAAAKLSRGFPFVRVDLYSVRGRAYFGEMTFYPGKGVEVFTPRDYDRIFGEHLRLEGLKG